MPLPVFLFLFLILLTLPVLIIIKVSGIIILYSVDMCTLQLKKHPNSEVKCYTEKGANHSRQQ